MKKRNLGLQRIHLKNAVILAPVFLYKTGDAVQLPKLFKSDLITMKRGKYGYSYARIYAGFDIETTNYIKDDIKEAYMYIWQFALCTEKAGVLFIGRTWNDFISLLQVIREHYEINEAQRLIIWDANLSFEFQFMRKIIPFDIGEYSFFAKEERKPLLATCYGGIEFRECLTITGGSLKQLAKDYTTTQKLEGDLDYSKLRNSKTPLTEKEIQYCYNDVIILAEFSQFIFDKYIIPDKRVPLTKTGLLRSEVKTELLLKCKDLKAYRDYIKTAFPSKDDYTTWFRYLFRGGFVHSNFSLTNEIFSNVQCYDITSSYPARMNLSYFPVTAFRDAPFKMEYLKTHCCIMVVTFYNIKTTTMHSIESLHKAMYYENVKTDNGRIYKADVLQVMLTELDYKNYCMFYRWERVKVDCFQIAQRGRLPAFIRNVLNRHYLFKASLKQKGLSGTPEYAIAKSGVNAAFGLMVTRISLDKVTINTLGEWVVDPVGVDFLKEVDKQVLLPQWGIYVAAHARRELLKMVKAIDKTCGNVVIYCDTDSIKCLYSPEIPRLVEKYNNTIAEQLKAVKLENNAFHDLGMFDNEYPDDVVTRFKTLGAKRYLTEINSKTIKATVAGLPKNTINKQGVDPFQLFDINGMKINAELSDKMTTAYNDGYTERIIDDGETAELMHEESSVALYEIPFTMLTEKDYYNLVINESMLRRKL